MAHEDRDKLFEKALARQLRSSASVAPGGVQGKPDAKTGVCPDEEILAAYRERVLTPGELILWKEHIAGCARCQQVLAHLEVTDEIPLNAEQETEIFAANSSQLVAAAPARGNEPLAAASSEGLLSSVPITSAKTQQPRALRRSVLRWVAPAAAIAAGLLVWVSLRENRNAPSLLPASQVQVAEKKSLPEPPAALPTGPQSSSAPQLDAKRDRDEEDKRADGLFKKQPAELNKELPAASFTLKDLPVQGRNYSQRLRLSPGVEGQLSQQNSNAGLGGVASNASNGARSSSNSLGNQVSNNQQNATAQENYGDVAAAKGELPPHAVLQRQQAPAAAPPPPAPPAKAAGAEEKPEVSQLTTVQATTAFDGVQSLKKEERKAKVENARFAVVSGGNVIWRVGLAGFIAQSRDGGRTFTQQESGVTTELTAAAAPSDSVCWAVGRSGTILRTIDGGAHWTKLTSPISQNLGGVQAEDALHAIVWDISNQMKFATNDGGVTWTRVPNE